MRIGEKALECLLAADCVADPQNRIDMLVRARLWIALADDIEQIDENAVDGSAFKSSGSERRQRQGDRARARVTGPANPQSVQSRHPNNAGKR